VLRDFYGPFERDLAQAQQEMRNVKRDEIRTGIACPRCGQGELAVKFGRNGEFLACTRYSKEGGEDSCDFTSDFHRNGEGQIVLVAASAPEMSDVMCHECGRPMVIKKSRFGPFLGCSGYPECKTTRRIGKDGKPAPLPEPTGVQCPKCREGELMKRRGRFGRPFFGWRRYPKCDYLVNDLAEVANYDPAAEAAKAEANAAASSAESSPAANGKSNGKASSKTSSKTSSKSNGKTPKSTAKKSTSKKAADNAEKPKAKSSSKSRAASKK
jgi:DNA topoisomerase-1